MTRSIMKNKRYFNEKLQKTAAVLLALLLWHVGARALNQPILLASPGAVAQRLCALALQGDFWQSIFFSLTRIACGFLLALAAATVLAALAGRFPAIGTLLWPYMSVIKATPVASFIILCLIWLSARTLPVFISFLMVLPILYTNLLKGIESTDPQLLEMARVFQMPRARRLMYIYLPQVRPYLLSGCSVSLGLSWKAGVAAEVIGITTGSIGERLYQAKIYFETADLLAWTVVIILISVLFEKFFLWLLSRVYDRLEAP